MTHYVTQKTYYSVKLDLTVKITPPPTQPDPHLFAVLIWLLPILYLGL